MLPSGKILTKRAHIRRGFAKMQLSAIRAAPILHRRPIIIHNSTFTNDSSGE